MKKPSFIIWLILTGPAGLLAGAWLLQGTSLSLQLQLAALWLLGMALLPGLWYRWARRREFIPIGELLDLFRHLENATEGDVPGLPPALKDLWRRLQQRYRVNRQFTQNAAHELQTPLTVIKAQIELLLQSPRLGESEMEALSLILQNTNRLARLNNALLLLTRIENRSFPDEQPLQLQDYLEASLDSFRELGQMLDLDIRRHYPQALTVSMSASLAEILVNNLVQNAIRHNVRGGFIEIRLENDTLSMTNPGAALDIPAESLFERFARQAHGEEGLGLGLAIVKSICERYHFDIRYYHAKGLHTLSIHFPPSGTTSPA